MPLFIKKDDRVSVSVDSGVNVIWVKRKMDVGTANRVQDAVMSVSRLDSRGQPSGFDINIGHYNTILLQYNIVDWEGPEFRDEDGHPVPCTPEAIETMDPDEPLVEAVLTRINELNRKPVVVEAGYPVDPLSSTTASSANGKKGSAQPQKAQTP